MKKTKKQAARDSKRQKNKILVCAVFQSQLTFLVTIKSIIAVTEIVQQ